MKPTSIAGTPFFSKPSESRFAKSDFFSISARFFSSFAPFAFVAAISLRISCSCSTDLSSISFPSRGRFALPGPPPGIPVNPAAAPGAGGEVTGAAAASVLNLSAGRSASSCLAFSRLNAASPSPLPSPCSARPRNAVSKSRSCASGFGGIISQSSRTCRAVSAAFAGVRCARSARSTTFSRPYAHGWR